MGTFFENQKVLVTGGAGLVGSNLVARLLQEGAHVRATCHRKVPVVRDDRIEYVWYDLTLGMHCRRAVEGMQYVFHCAANTSGAKVMAETPMVQVVPNILINAQMLEAAHAAHVEKFLWLSSSTGYPPSGDRPVREEEMFDGEPYEKYFFVGWMKRFTEVLCKMYGEKLPAAGKRGMTTIVLRPTNIYGVGDDFDFETSHVVPALVRKVVERWDPVEVWGKGNEVRDMIYVSDVVEAMVSAMEKVEKYDVFNVGSGKSHSVAEILQMILEIDGYSSEANVVYDASKPTMIPIRLVDTSKIERTLGFKAKVGLQEGLERTIRWYRASR